MKKQQTFLVELDLVQIRNYCDRLPLEETDRNIAFALAQLCADRGSYTPARGVGQKEIANLAGVSVRTVKRRLDYLKRYGILTVKKTNGKSNSYQFDLGMLIAAPAITHDLYGYIKARPAPAQAKAEVIINERQRLLFDEQGEVESTAPAQEDCSLLSRMTGAVAQFTKRMFTTAKVDSGETTGASTSEPVPNQCQTGDTLTSTGAKPVTPSSEPVPKRCQTSATSEKVSAEPVPSEEFGAEVDPEPVPNRCHGSPNQCQSGAKPVPTAPTLHTHNTSTGSGTLIKNHIEHKHVHVDLNSDSFEAEGSPPPDWNLPPSTTRRNSELPPGERKVIWKRDVRVDDLSNPAALQELYAIAVEQGFFLESEHDRENFFSLAHYVCRQKKARSKVGLFSSLVDRTSKSKINCEWEKNLSHDDDKWAVQAIHDYDFPPLEGT